MRKLIITALLAAVALPGVASAQSQREVNRDRRDLRQEQRELNRAYRGGDPRQIRDQRDDVRDARQELREDRRDRNRAQDRNWGRNDWRGYRDGNRALYARGNWRAPFRYNAFRAGVRIAPTYYGSRYFIADPWRYRLPNPGFNQRWVRHYDDVILVDTRRGIVIDVIRSFYR